MTKFRFEKMSMPFNHASVDTFEPRWSQRQVLEARTLAGMSRFRAPERCFCPLSLPGTPPDGGLCERRRGHRVRGDDSDDDGGQVWRRGARVHRRRGGAAARPKGEGEAAVLNGKRGCVSLSKCGRVFISCVNRQQSWVTCGVAWRVCHVATWAHSKGGRHRAGRRLRELRHGRDGL